MSDVECAYGVGMIFAGLLIILFFALPALCQWLLRVWTRALMERGYCCPFCYAPPHARPDEPDRDTLKHCCPGCDRAGRELVSEWSGMTVWRCPHCSEKWHELNADQKDGDCGLED